MKPRTVCFCQPVALHNLLQRGPALPLEHGDDFSLRRALARLASGGFLGVSVGLGSAFGLGLGIRLAPGLWCAPGAPVALGRGGVRIRGRLRRDPFSESLDRGPDARHSLFALLELLDRLAIRERRDARKAVPQLHQPAERPLGGGLGQILFAADQDGAGRGLCGFLGLRFCFVDPDVVVVVDRENQVYAPL
jgi:hypothetical protein